MPVGRACFVEMVLHTANWAQLGLTILSPRVNMITRMALVVSTRLLSLSVVSFAALLSHMVLHVLVVLMVQTTPKHWRLGVCVRVAVGVTVGRRFGRRLTTERPGPGGTCAATTETRDRETT